MKPQFEKKKFSVVYGSRRYNTNYGQIFSKKYSILFNEMCWYGQKPGVYMGRVEVFVNKLLEEIIFFTFTDYDNYIEIRNEWDCREGITETELKKLKKILKQHRKSISKTDLEELKENYKKWVEQ